MSINSAMLSGVSGLIANSAALGAISDNIANVNTVGYKENTTQFEDLVTSKAVAGNYNSGGVQADVTQLISQQGQFTQTSSSTDLAINGSGFFVVADTAAGLSATSGPSYTRAGSFTANSAGYLENTAGLYLQGWPADSAGNITTSPSDLSELQTININGVGSSPDPTTTASISANLDSATAVSAAAATYNAATNSMASGAVTPDVSNAQITVYDGQGGQHTLQLDLLNVSNTTNTSTTPSTVYGPNTWAAEVVDPTAGDVTSANGQIASGTITFSSTGAIASSTLPASLTIPWSTASGLGTQTVALNLSGASGSLTQQAGNSTVNSISADGGPAGSLTGVTVGSDGKVTANFSNGATRTIAQVAIATFADPNGLTAVTGNAYAATDQSGTVVLKTPEQGGAGQIESSQLEASTVDLSTEFTNLIITQRAYSAASKIITTADQMLQELIAVKQ
jgi:flagellar hook protein FlgE